jgi:ribosomal protein L37AE/L43A
MKERDNKRPCPRCGVMHVRRVDAVVCRDCKSVLTPEEWEQWKVGIADVESSHGKEAA